MLDGLDVVDVACRYAETLWPQEDGFHEDLAATRPSPGLVYLFLIYSEGRQERRGRIHRLLGGPTSGRSSRAAHLSACRHR